MTALIGDAKPVESKAVKVELPEIAENGNVVPIAITVDSPMTAENYVNVVHIFATGNPRPDVASLYFTPDNGVATVATRIRLSRTQDVVVIAGLSDGQFIMSMRQVKVTIGGCGG